MSLPVVVDIDTIKSLRLQGRHGEADAHLAAFHKSLADSKRQLENELERRERAKRRILGLCTILGCPRDALPGRSHCETHRAYYRDANRRTT